MARVGECRSAYVPGAEHGAIAMARVGSVPDILNRTPHRHYLEPVALGACPTHRLSSKRSVKTQTEVRLYVNDIAGRRPFL